MIKIIDLIHMIEDFIGKKAQIVTYPPHPADVFSNWANVDKAGRMLGWEPRVILDEGVRKLIDWYNAERSWAREVDTG